ncbi:GH25 family lysozyme [Mesorhizobium calcicola]|uniref:GH25 family lysozyme n=1 Tax=Mesorhizobium calcicola TaxID=1300310 RepID=A0ABW4WNT0_9HYPH
MLRVAIGLSVLWLLLGCLSARAEVCDTGNAVGAEVKDVKYCRFFTHYENGATVLDPRIGESVHVTSSDDTRSIGLIIAIADYQNEGVADVSAAAVDGDNLTKFLIDNQHFDEVIVLRDSDASKDTIDYFLRDYLVKRGDFFSTQEGGETKHKARLLVAYSGHGTSGSDASFVLANATSMDDTSATYPMASLRDNLKKLSSSYFHVLALVNACFGGNLFGDGSMGGSLNDFTEAGSHALTAGPDNKETLSIGAGNGSFFFDTLLNGIEEGVADIEYKRLISEDGKLIQQGGVTRLGALSVYLDTEIQRINHKKMTDKDGNPIEMGYAWIGAIDKSVARGSFFFTSPITLGEGVQTAMYVPPGPASSVPDHPEVKVFGSAETYPVKGIDVSRYEGTINWKRVKKEAGVQFAYIRAVGIKGKDDAFEGHWAKAKDVGIDRGAYRIFNYCQTPKEQMELLESFVPVDDSSLPVAVSYEWPLTGAQKKCASDDGITKTRAKVLTLLGLIEAKYKKTPILYSPKSLINELLTPDFDRYMIWLAKYTKTGKVDQSDLGLKGGNPWTLWQYTSGLTVPGIGDNVDGNVFFGGAGEYEKFKIGAGNAALLEAKAVDPKTLKENEEAFLAYADVKNDLSAQDRMIAKQIDGARRAIQDAIENAMQKYETVK